MSTRSWVIDLDGVIWCGADAVDGSAAAVAELRSRGDRLVFATNHSAPTRGELIAQLGACGVAATPDEVQTSADAAATMVRPGETVLAFAGAGVVEALRRRHVTVVDRGSADAVVVGWHAHLDLAGLTHAVRTVLGGARLIGTNDDRVRPTGGGLVPGAGAFLAAVERATGATSRCAGKPYEPMAQLLRPLVSGDVTVVGDSVVTDGALARRLSARFALVLSGVTTVEPEECHADLVADDLWGVVTQCSEG